MSCVGATIEGVQQKDLVEVVEAATRDVSDRELRALLTLEVRDDLIDKSVELSLGQRRSYDP